MSLKQAEKAFESVATDYREVRLALLLDTL